jgi:hypothetical protein
MLDESSLSGVRRGSSGSAFSHLKGSRAASKEDVNASPSRSFEAKMAVADKLADSASKESPGSYFVCLLTPCHIESRHGIR